MSGTSSLTHSIAPLISRLTDCRCTEHYFDIEAPESVCLCLGLISRRDDSLEERHLSNWPGRLAICRSHALIHRCNCTPLIGRAKGKFAEGKIFCLEWHLLNCGHLQLSLEVPQAEAVCGLPLPGLICWLPLVQTSS